MDASAVRSFFEAVAADWDTMRLAYYDERVIETMADAIGLNGTQTVVDVGTGTGFVAAGLAPRSDRVIALDHSPAMLDVARRNLGDLGIDNVSSVRATSGTYRSTMTRSMSRWPTWCSTTPRIRRR